MRHEANPGPEGCRACNAALDRAQAKRQSLFERMAEAQRLRAEEADAIRHAKPGDQIVSAPPRLEVRPAFTGAGAPTFKPARHGDRPPGK